MMRYNYGKYSLDECKKEFYAINEEFNQIHEQTSHTSGDFDDLRLTMSRASAISARFRQLANARTTRKSKRGEAATYAGLAGCTSISIDFYILSNAGRAVDLKGEVMSRDGLEFYCFARQEDHGSYVRKVNNIESRMIPSLQPDILYNYDKISLITAHKTRKNMSSRRKKRDLLKEFDEWFERKFA